MPAARRPRGFDVQCWDNMGEHQRQAEVARHNAVAAARRRYEAQSQRAQATYDRTMRRARRELDLALAAATKAYREAEDADPINRRMWE